MWAIRKLQIAYISPCGSRHDFYQTRNKKAQVLTGAVMSPRYHLAGWLLMAGCSAFTVTGPVIQAGTKASPGSGQSADSITSAAQ
jgi:hypothetical protein